MKIDIDQFDPFNLELPIAENTFCKEAVSIGLEIFRDQPQEEATNEIKRILCNKMGSNQKATVVPIERQPARQREAYTSPIDIAALNGSTDEHLKNAYEPLHMNQNDHEVSPEEQIKSLSACLLHHVHFIKLCEDLALKESNSNYRYVMETLDPLLNDLHLLAGLTNSFIPTMDLIRLQVSRITGASKGGKARNQRFKEIEEHIIEKDYTLHPEKTAAASARAIFADLDEATWLLDDKGQPLLVDPVQRFTSWIRKARNQKTQK